MGRKRKTPARRQHQLIQAELYVLPQYRMPDALRLMGLVFRSRQFLVQCRTPACAGFCHVRSERTMPFDPADRLAAFCSVGNLLYAVL